MKRFEFDLYDELERVSFFLNTYSNDTTYVGAISFDEEENEDFYGDISVNLPHGTITNEREIYADVNNSQVIINAMLKAGLLEETNESCPSGFVVYPKVKLTDKFYEYVVEVLDEDKE